MHIPDGLLGAEIIIATSLISVGGLSLAAKNAKNQKTGLSFKLIAGITAFLLAAQSLDFPTEMTLSLHFFGAALAVILLGLWSGSLVLGSILLFQSVVLHDGGILALGANISNMAIIGAFTAHLTYTFLAKQGTVTFRNLAVFLASFISIMCASFAAGFELGLSGVLPIQQALSSVIYGHIVFAIGESFITVLAINLVRKSFPGYYGQIKFSQARIEPTSA